MLLKLYVYKNQTQHFNIVYLMQLLCWCKRLVVPCCLLDGICLNSIDKPTCTVDIYKEVTHSHNEFHFKSWKVLDTRQSLQFNWSIRCPSSMILLPSLQETWVTSLTLTTIKTRSYFLRHKGTRFPSFNPRHCCYSLSRTSSTNHYYWN